MGPESVLYDRSPGKWIPPESGEGLERADGLLDGLKLDRRRNHLGSDPCPTSAFPRACAAATIISACPLRPGHLSVTIRSVDLPPTGRRTCAIRDEERI